MCTIALYPYIELNEKDQLCDKPRDTRFYDRLGTEMTRMCLIGAHVNIKSSKGEKMVSETGKSYAMRKTHNLISGGS